MSRLPRNFISNSFYHIYNRGNNKEPILKHPADKQLFIHLLYKYKKTCGIRLVTYCIMDNHFHLIIKTGNNPHMLSRFMQKVGTSFAVQINKKYQKVGHVFQGRYNANYLPYKKDLTRALDYTRKNPIQEDLVRKPSDYRWSKRI